LQEEGSDVTTWQSIESLNVLSWHHENMTLEQRGGVEKGHGVVMVEHHVRRLPSGDDVAKQTAWRSVHLADCRPSTIPTATSTRTVTLRVWLFDPPSRSGVD
jgi:hypothetical protein